MSCACLLPILDEQRAPRKTVFQRAMGQRLADRDYVIFWLSFRYRSGPRLGHLVVCIKQICKTMLILGNPSFENS